MTWRPTTKADLAFVVALEADPANAPFIKPWRHDEHLDTLTDPDALHLVFDGPGGSPAGFMILVDLLHPARVVQLLRLVIADKGRGLGRAGVREAKRIAFEQRGAVRLWLDVKHGNTRARSLYESEGFVLQRPTDDDDPRFHILAIERSAI
ncbi:MAG TPA: GNAT family N-acetyltransferase [Kofleriaceae bacterium]|nr:GNAT family N-acetyltransferase [Kofleriaceae bacterium]